MLAALCALALVTRLVFLYYYNIFFFEGDEFDLNIFAHLIWRNDTFNYFAHFPQSFFSIHLTLFLYGVNQLSYLAPVDQETWFAGFMALVHGAFVPVFCFLWWRVTMMRLAGSRSRVTIMAIGIGSLGAVLATGFALNGVVLNALWIGHYEFVIPLFILLQLVALAYRSPWAIALTTALLLSTREDAGFHAFGFLTLLIVVRLLFGRQKLHELYPESVTAVVCLGYSIFCFTVVMPALQAFGVFNIIFAGDPPWAHLSWARVGEILALHWTSNGHILWPALLLLVAAPLLRRPMYMVAALAPLPWLLLHLIAVNTDAAYLAHYKAFPWMLLYVWPVFVEADAMIRCDAFGRLRPGLRITGMVLVQTAVIGLGLLPWNDLGSPLAGHNRSRISGLHACARDRTAYDAFHGQLAGMRSSLGPTLVSSGVLRYAPDVFDSSESLLWYDVAFHQRVSELAPDTVIFLAHGRAAIAMRRAANQRGLKHYYAVPGTGFVLARAAALSPDSARGGGLVPISSDAPLPVCFKGVSALPRVREDGLYRGNDGFANAIVAPGTPLRGAR